MAKRDAPPAADGPAVGTPVEMEITGLGHAGEGIGRWRGMAVFVPGALPGERVRAEIRSVKKNYALARLRQVLEQSRFRVEPDCARFGSCGGCQLLHLAYPEQLRWKTRRVRENLARIGGLEGVAVAETLGTEQPWHYRHKVHFHLERRGGRLAFGYFFRGSHALAAAEEADESGCLLVHRDLLRLVREAVRILQQLDVPLYDWERKRGYLRNLVLRRAAASGEMMLVLVTGREQWPGEEEFVRRLAAAEPDAVSVVRNVNTRGTREVLGPENRVLFGKPAITERLGGLEFAIGPATFFQVNPVQAEKLFETAADFAALTGRETVVDAYSGAGAIALWLAGRARRVIGLEALAPAVADSRKNARGNRIANVRFEQGPVERLLPALAAKNGRVDVVVLDPPRRGCAPPVLEAAARLRPSRIVYISCDPATLARDLGRLHDLGFRLEAVQPVDMFPQTAHVECVALLRKNGL